MGRKQGHYGKTFITNKLSNYFSLYGWLLNQYVLHDGNKGSEK